MNSKIVIAILILLTAGGLVYLGYSLRGEVIREVSAEVNIDSLKEKWLMGKMDIEDLALLQNENDELRQILNKRQAGWKPQIVYVDSGKNHAMPPMPVEVVKMDSTFPVNVSATVIAGDETTHTAVATEISANIWYYGDPFWAFRIKNISVKPFAVEAKVKDYPLPVADNDNGFPVIWIESTLGFGPLGGIGAAVHVDRLGFEYFKPFEGAPIYVGKYVVWHW